MVVRSTKKLDRRIMSNCVRVSLCGVRAAAAEELAGDHPLIVTPANSDTGNRMYVRSKAFSSKKLYIQLLRMIVLKYVYIL